jgi:MarR family 2-MHQ and catechol resistance regulon transcriptional repressor
VARHASGEDRRSKLVALTREGKGFITELYARHVRDIEAVTSSLSDKERTKLRSLLKTLGLAARDATAERAQRAMAAAKLLKTPKPGRGRA